MSIASVACAHCRAVEGDDLQELLDQARENASYSFRDRQRGPPTDDGSVADGDFTLARTGKVNPSVRQEEIDLLVAQRRDLEEHLSNARIRLDAIKVGTDLL
jgi:hypothetical protein